MQLKEDISTSFWAFIKAVISHWVILMSGSLLVVLLGIFERWSQKSVPFSIYEIIIIFFLFLSCYLAWRDARKKLKTVVLEKESFLENDSTDTQKRAFIIDNLRELIREGREVGSYGALMVDFENMGKIDRREKYKPTVERFLNSYFDESYVQRFQEKGEIALEEILAECINQKSL